METYVAMYKVKNDSRMYYCPTAFKTSDAAWRKLRSLKVHDEAGVAFVLTLDDEERITDFFPAAVNFEALP